MSRETTPDAPAERWVYVRGAGGVSALGATLEETLAAAPDACGFVAPPGERAAFPTPFDPMKHLPRAIGRRLGQQPGMMLGALREATDGVTDLADAGLFLGTAHGAMHATIDFIGGVVRHGAKFASPLLFAHSLHNAMAGAASRTLRTCGPSIVTCNGAASFEAALLQAVTMLRAGTLDCALVGGSDTFHESYGAALGVMGLLSDEPTPLDPANPAPGAGTQPGEAAGALLLEAGPAGGTGTRIAAVHLGPQATEVDGDVARLVVLADGSTPSALRHDAALGRIGPGALNAARTHPARRFGASGSLSALAVAIDAGMRLRDACNAGPSVVLNATLGAGVATVVIAGSGRGGE